LGVFAKKKPVDRKNVEQVPKIMHGTLSTISKSLAFVDKMAGKLGQNM
jgi:hypothetical protein